MTETPEARRPLPWPSMKRGMGLALLLLVLSACEIRVEQLTELNEDGSGTVSASLAMDEEFRDLLALGDSTQDPLAQIESQTPEGWQSDRFTEGGFQGVRISRGFADLDEFRTAASEMMDDPTQGIFESYRISQEGRLFRFDARLGDLPAQLGDELPIRGQALDELLQVRVMVRLPGRITEHNADQIEDGLLVWEVAVSEGSRNLSARSSTYGPGVWLAAALVALVAVVVGAALFARSRRRTPEVQAPEEVPAPPATWGAEEHSTDPEHER